MATAQAWKVLNTDPEGDGGFSSRGGYEGENPNPNPNPTLTLTLTLTEGEMQNLHMEL